MLYLVDANVLIDANRDYYPQQRVPEFWSWLLHQAQEERIKVPNEIHLEVSVGKGDLVDWLKKNKSALILSEDAAPPFVQRAVYQGYARDLTEEEVARLGNDPFLVAYALAHPGASTVVTTETSKPRRQRANRHLPDVCATLNIPCIHTFELLRRLNFSTDWQHR